MLAPLFLIKLVKSSNGFYAYHFQWPYTMALKQTTLKRVELKRKLLSSRNLALLLTGLLLAYWVFIQNVIHKMEGNWVTAKLMARPGLAWLLLSFSPSLFDVLFPVTIVCLICLLSFWSFWLCENDARHQGGCVIAGFLAFSLFLFLSRPSVR